MTLSAAEADVAFSLVVQHAESEMRDERELLAFRSLVNKLARGASP